MLIFKIEYYLFSFKWYLLIILRVISTPHSKLYNLHIFIYNIEG